MGNKIRVELSHGGGRTAKYAGEPGACFKCGQHGHWARYVPTPRFASCILTNGVALGCSECPNHSSVG